MPRTTHPRPRHRHSRAQLWAATRSVQRRRIARWRRIEQDDPQQWSERYGSWPRNMWSRNPFTRLSRDHRPTTTRHQQRAKWGRYEELGA